MKSILFFHPKNDYTGSTRVLADVIARDYAGQSVDIIVNRNHGKGFLSELSNVQLMESVSLLLRHWCGAYILCCLRYV